MNRVLLTVTVLAVLLLLVGSYLILTASAPIASTDDAHYTRFTINGRVFVLTYIATNETALQKGLMNTKVTNTTTMLFVFPTPGYYSFWMYDVNSSLDMIWVNSTAGLGKVVYQVDNVPGCTVSLLCAYYQNNAKANLVIEAKAGFARANNIVVGTPVRFP